MVSSSIPLPLTLISNLSENPVGSALRIQPDSAPFPHSTVPTLLLSTVILPLHQCRPALVFLLQLCPPP